MSVEGPFRPPDAACTGCGGTGAVYAPASDRAPTEAQRARLEEHARVVISDLVPGGQAFIMRCPCTWPLPSP